MKYILLVLISSALLILSFPHTGSFTPLVFVGLVPLLYLRSELLRNNKKSVVLFFSTYLTFLIWNIGTTWWVANASVSGAILAFAVNALLMSTIFCIWSWLHRKINANFSYWLLIPLWLLFEFGHHRWDLSWPWLTLGNYFSVRTGWVQWYEWTGTLGGSTWVLLVNLMLFRLYNVYRDVAKRNRNIFIILGILFLPIIVSQIILINQIFLSFRAPHVKMIQTVVLQPNIDPYKEKFAASASNEAFTDSLLQLANQHVTSQTDLVIAPETALPLSFLEDRLHTFEFGRTLQEQVAKWPKANMLIGASTVKLFDSKQSVASTPIPGENRWFESYNAALLLTQNKAPQYTHKSKLVPGVELIPFSAYLPFLSAIAIENGGTSGTLGTEREPKVMEIPKAIKSANLNSETSQKTTLAPIICYESIYGDFVRQQVQKGAQLLCIITNDGWWGDTPGYKQHFSFARLRAIETRRWVLRSANTGSSGSIDPTGKIIKKTSYWTKTAFSQVIELRKDKTFYTKHGDWIAGLSLSWILLVCSNILMKKANQKRKSNA
ncbi:MAG: apolipoprotein N-acyltransferase [Flavobacteriales bacterium]